jgi:putative intracellular protease/amidase
MNKQNAILVVVTSHDRLPNQEQTGLWFEEYATPSILFKRNGYTITVASLLGGAAPIDPRSLPPQRNDAEVQFALHELQHTTPLHAINPADYAAVFFPGGHGTMFDLADSAAIGQTILSFMESGRVVAAVCHGPAALVGARYRDGTPVVKGRKLTSFTNEEESAAQLDKWMPFPLQSRLRELGAEFVPSPNWNDHVIIDGKLITGQNPQSSASIAAAMLQVLQTQ